MRKNVYLLLVGCAAAVVLSGCVTARTYVVNKERVDQEIPGQPANTPVKTRKMIVVEVVEKDKAGKVIEGQGKASVSSAKTGTESDFTLPLSVPASVPAESLPAAEPQAYVVQKDDTLQKIAKKVYGSYSKWTKIYEANRDVIKDPNFLKPGLTLKIPEIPVEGAEVKPSPVN